MPPTTTITRPLPNAVTYDLSSPHKTTITLPSTSNWTSGLHWHERHVEYLHLTRGSIQLRLGNRVSILHASDESTAVKINIGVRHEWRRAPDSKGDVVVVESTNPADREKALFFYNLNGVILRAQNQGNAAQYRGELLAKLYGYFLSVWVPLQLFVIFAELDNFPVFWDLGGKEAARGSEVGLWMARWLEWVVAHVVLGLAAVGGRALGVRAVREEFMPGDVYEQWRRRGTSEGKAKGT